MVLEASACLDQVALIPVSLHWFHKNMKVLFSLSLSNTLNATVRGIQIRKVERVHTRGDMIMKIFSQSLWGHMGHVRGLFSAGICIAIPSVMTTMSSTSVYGMIQNLEEETGLQIDWFDFYSLLPILFLTEEGKCSTKIRRCIGIAKKAC